MAKSNQRYRLTVTFAILVVSVNLPMHRMNTAAAQQSKANCQLLATQYPVLQSPFYWLSDDKVIFQVGLGLPPNGIAPNPEIWYVYQLSVRKLDQLPTMPDLIPTQFVEIAKSALAVYQPIEPVLMRFSPSGRKVLYALGDRDKNNLTYWLKDVDSNKTYSLDIPTYGSWMPTVYWFPNENQFIIQADASQVSPIYQVTLDQDGIHKTDLTALAPFKELGLGAFQNSVYGYWVAGLNPSGTMVVLQPDGFSINEIYEHNVWIFDLTNARLQKPDFFVTGDYQVRWKDDDTFIVPSNWGVVEYNIREQRSRVLLSLEETGFKAFTIQTGLSPKANFLISSAGNRDLSTKKGAVTLCEIPQ